jgi:hypothetical protein
MRNIIIVLTGAAVLALTAPASAQIGVRAGERGVDLRIGDRDRDYYRDHDRDRIDRDRIVHFRDWDEWRAPLRHRDCDRFWRHGRRITVCRD